MRAVTSEFGRHGNGTYGDIGIPVPTEIGYSVPTRGGSKGSNLCRSGGLHARDGNTRERKSGNMDCAILEGSPFRDRCIAQACNCVPFIMNPERMHIGEQEPVTGPQFPLIEAGYAAVSKGGALESRPPEIDTGPVQTEPVAKGSNPSCLREALAVCSTRPTELTWEALRPDAVRDGTAPSPFREAWLCVGAFASRSKIPRAVRSKHGREHTGFARQGGPLPRQRSCKISKANSVRRGTRAGARKNRDA